jgi:hypothetical protein
MQKMLTKGEIHMKRTSIIKVLQHSICLLLLLQAYSAQGAEEDRFPPGAQLAQFTVGVPDSSEVQKYLGLKSETPFKLSDISAKMVLIDFTNSA